MTSAYIYYEHGKSACKFPCGLCKFHHPGFLVWDILNGLPPTCELGKQRLFMRGGFDSEK